MQYSYKKINIDAPFPTTQCGHASQTELIFEFKDHLFGRVIGFKDESHWIIHISMDLLCFTLPFRNKLQDQLRQHYKNDNLVLITSTTHTHYANSARDEKYVNYLVEALYKNIIEMEYVEKGEITSSFVKVHTNAVGKSRITGYESNLEFLCLLRFYSKEDNFLSIVINNCHPTTLAANVPYFSAEYPGYVLRRLEETYPNENFSFILGCSGDISSRFVRKGQDYDAMCELAENLYKEILPLLNKEEKKVPLSLEYKEVTLPYQHEFNPIDISKLGKVSDRELETIKLGQVMRENMKTKPSKIFGYLLDSVQVGCWYLGSIKVIFYPNEIFSAYLNYLNLEDTYMVSYSNGYGPYILPIGFEHVTYEMFIDTLSDETKKKLIETIQQF